MTEYLILTQSRAIPLVWEFNKEIPFNLTFSQSFSGSFPKSRLARSVGSSAGSTTIRINDGFKIIFRSFGTPSAPTSVPNGVKIITKPRLLRLAFTLSSWTGNPQFRIELRYANSDGTPTNTTLASFTPSVFDHGGGVRTVYVEWTLDDALMSAPELDWDTLYSAVLVPTYANSSNYADIYDVSTGGDPMVTHTSGWWDQTWQVWRTLSSGREWNAALNYAGITRVPVAIAFYYVLNDGTAIVSKSSEAYRTYLHGWASRTTPPSGIILIPRANINGIFAGVGTEVPFTDTITYSAIFYTTTNVSVSNHTQTDELTFSAKYDVNPVTVDMFYASEAYLQQIDFLDSGTNSVRLNDSYEQEFSGAGGSSIVFDPPVLWWKAQVLSGRVRLKALVFE